MKILAIETSSNACSVALLNDDIMHAQHQIVPMRQAQLILPMIDALLNSANITLSQLDALAFGCGPGSFTGVRIATSVMQGIGFATQLPLIPVSSLAAVAQAAYQYLGWKKMLVGMDARIQEVYWGAYQVNETGLVELVGKEIVCPPEQVTQPSDPEWYGVGTAWDVYKDSLAVHPIAMDGTRLPLATAVATLAQHLYTKKSFTPLNEAMPVYLRDDVAKKQSAQKR